MQIEYFKVNDREIDKYPAATGEKLKLSWKCNGCDAYETVCDILTGEEETLKYVKVNGQELMVTMDHPVMTKEGWKPARDLREGEQILLQDGNLYPVQEIMDELEKVINL